MKSLALVFVFLSFSAHAAVQITYFDCAMKEGKTDVHVKFAIKNFDPEKARGSLVNYPGVDEDEGPIFVSPKQIGKRFAMMTNLNSQGGDLRILKDGDIHLFGDGDGYQFTDMVIWADLFTDENYIEGFVRDYGPAYGDKPSTKIFISCKKADKPL